MYKRNWPIKGILRFSNASRDSIQDQAFQLKKKTLPVIGALNPYALIQSRPWTLNHQTRKGFAVTSIKKLFALMYFAPHRRPFGDSLPQFSKVSRVSVLWFYTSTCFRLWSKTLKNVAQIILYYHMVKRILLYTSLLLLTNQVLSISECVLEKH